MATKAKVEDTTTDTPETNEGNPLFDAARKVLLASIGAVVLAQDEIEDFVKKLVERGEIAEREGKKLVIEIKDKRKMDAKKAEDEITKKVEDVLDRMNVPSKSDIDALGDKITTLSKKVDDLIKAQ